MGNKCCCSDRSKAERCFDIEDKDFENDETDDLLNGIPEPADEPAPEPSAEPAEVAAQAAVGAADEGAKESAGEPVVRSYVVDNAQLQAESMGLAYRQSTRLDDVHADLLAEWGCTVEGKDVGDGWVEVPDDTLSLFLPMELRGVPVLTVQAEGEVSFGFSGLSNFFVDDNDVDDLEEDEHAGKDQDPSDTIGFGNLFGGDDGSEAGEAFAEEGDILGLGSLFGNGLGVEEGDFGGEGHALRDPGTLPGPGSLSESQKDEEKPAATKQSTWDLYDTMFGGDEEDEDKEGEKKRRKKSKKNNRWHSDEDGSFEVAVVQSRAAAEDQGSAAVLPAAFASDQQAASSSDHWPMRGAEMQNVQSKDSLRAALKDAAEARDVDMLQSALRDAVDGGVGAKDLGKAWNVLADEQRKAAADEERKRRALQALTVATELRHIEKIQAALQEGREAGLKEAFLKPAKAILKDLEARERKKKEESQSAARGAIQALMTGRRATALLLQQAIQRGEEAGLQAEEISQARDLLAERQAATRNRLAKAVMDRNIDELKHALQEGEESGLSPEYLSHGQQLLPKLEKKSAAHAALAKAAAGNNVDVLRRALSQGEQAGLEESVLATARMVLNLQSARADFAEKEGQKVEARKALQAAMSEQDIIDLRSAIEAAEKAGIEDAEELKAARILLAKETEKMVARRTLDACDLDVVKIFSNSQVRAPEDGPGPNLFGIKVTGASPENSTEQRGTKGGRANMLLPPSKGSAAPSSKAASSSPAGSRGPSLRAWGQKRSQTPTGAHAAKPRLRSSSRVSLSRGGSVAAPEVQLDSKSASSTQNVNFNIIPQHQGWWPKADPGASTHADVQRESATRLSSPQHHQGWWPKADLGASAQPTEQRESVTQLSALHSGGADVAAGATVAELPAARSTLDVSGLNAVQPHLERRMNSTVDSTLQFTTQTELVDDSNVKQADAKQPASETEAKLDVESLQYIELPLGSSPESSPERTSGSDGAEEESASKHAWVGEESF